MPTYGLTATGFLAPTYDEIVTLIEDAWRDVLGANTKVGVAPLSDMIAIQAARELSLWQALESEWVNAFPDTAEGAALDANGARESVYRVAAIATMVGITITGTPTTTIPDGSIVADPSTGTRWVVSGPVVIGGGGTVAAVVRCEVTGPVPALAGTLTQIVTAVTGWVSVTNAADHTQLGSDVEVDATYKARILTAIGGPTVDTVDDVYRAVAAVADVVEVRVFENATDAVDDAGRPGHSIEVVVRGGTDAAVAAAIWSAKAGGGATFGTTTQAVTDANGDSQDVNFSRPSNVPIYVTVEVTLGGKGVWPSDGPDQAEALVLAYGASLRSGDDVISRDLDDAILLPGIRRTVVKLGLSASPTGTDDLEIGATSRAVFDSARVTVTVV